MTENTLKITFQQAREHRQAARERLRHAEAGDTDQPVEQDVRSILNFEDFDGGYVWELGLAFYRDVRRKLWILKRAYDDQRTERQRYDNGMAASQMAALTEAGRTIEWSDTDELREAVEEIP